MITRSLKGKILVFIVFFLGMVTGVLIANIYETRVIGTRGDREDRSSRAQRDVNAFHDYLGLDEAQRAQVHKILEETRNEFRELRAQTQPQFQAIEQKSRDKIHAVLTDEQRQKYDERRKKFQQRRKDR